MTASVDARQVADLEELFGREIPCGGNRLTGPCPDSAAAVWRRMDHGCGRNHTPQSFKCDSCFRSWRDIVLASNLAVICDCGLAYPSGSAAISEYVPL